MSAHHPHVAAYGHEHPLDQLVADLRCPRCGYHDACGSHSRIADNALRYFCDSCGAFVTVSVTEAQARVLETWLADRPILVVMGVTGCGKSMIGRTLAQRLELPFREGEHLHSEDDAATLAAGTPLDDTKHAAWLSDVAREISVLRAGNRGGVMTCSSLTGDCRAALQADGPPLVFVHLHGNRELIEERLTARRGPSSSTELLEAQLAMLEPLPDTAIGVTVDGLDGSPEEIVAEILQRLPAALGL